MKRGVHQGGVYLSVAEDVEGELHGGEPVVPVMVRVVVIQSADGAHEALHDRRRNAKQSHSPRALHHRQRPLQEVLFAVVPAVEVQAMTCKQTKKEDTRGTTNHI